MLPESFERRARGVFFLALTILVLSVLVCAPIMEKRIEENAGKRLDAMSNAAATRLDSFGERLDARDKQVGQVLKNVNDYAEQNYWDVYALNETAVTTARQFSEFLRKTDEHVNGTEGKPGILDEVHALLRQTRESSVELEADLHKVLVSTDNTLKPLQEAFQNVASITTKLDKQMTTTGEGVDTLIADLDTAINHVNDLLADPNIAATLLNVQESTKSIDIALRPWRERAQMLKVILGKVLSMLPGIGTALAR